MQFSPTPGRLREIEYERDREGGQGSSRAAGPIRLREGNGNRGDRACTAKPQEVSRRCDRSAALVCCKQRRGTACRAPTGSNVVIKLELVRVRPHPHRVNFVLPLV